MAVDVQAEVHRVDAEMRCSGFLPGGDVALPVLLSGAKGVDPGVDADPFALRPAASAVSRSN